MSKGLLTSSRFKSEIKKFYQKNKKEILDIVLFGSYARGKKRHSDIDLLVIFKEKDNTDLIYELRKSLEKYGNLELVGKSYRNLFSSSFLPRESVIVEGYSLIFNKTLSNLFGFKGFYGFIYTLKGFSNSQRMRFHYALNGRGTLSGMIKDTKSIKLTDTLILVPINMSDVFEDFLKEWNVQYKKIQILLPERTVDYREFEL